MLTRIFYQLASMAAVLLAVITLVFAMLHLAGDPTDALIPPGSDPADVAALRERYGLDEPVARQYTTFVANAVQGNFGVSWRYDRPAREVVFDRLPATLELVAAALLVAVAVASSLGVLAAARPGGPFDVLSHLVSLAGQAIPSFWLGTLLIMVASVRLGWAPSSGREGLSSMILPVLTLAAYPMAVLLRMVRASIEEAYAQDYVRTARAKGLTEAAVLVSHVVRNAAPAPIAYAGVLAGFLLAGSVVVESVFAYPGAGQLALQSVSSRDLPVVLMFVTCTAFFIVLANLVADVVALAVNPLLRRADARAGAG